MLAGTGCAAVRGRVCGRSGEVCDCGGGVRGKDEGVGMSVWSESVWPAIREWIIRRLFPVAEPDPAPAPVVPEVVDHAITGEGSQTFLWKPKSENDGKLVVLLPARVLFADIEEVYVEGGDHDGEKATNVYRPEYHQPNTPVNGNRVHARFKRKGSDYGERIDLVVEKVDGSVEKWHIKKGKKRTEHR